MSEERHWKRYSRAFFFNFQFLNVLFLGLSTRVLINSAFYSKPLGSPQNPGSNSKTLEAATPPSLHMCKLADSIEKKTTHQLLLFPVTQIYVHKLNHCNYLNQYNKHLVLVLTQLRLTLQKNKNLKVNLYHCFKI